MADEDDETFPPETQKQPTEFAFREFSRQFLTTAENDPILHLRNNLLAVANVYGLVFAGYPTGFKVYNDSELLVSSKEKDKIPEPVVDVPLRSSPHWLAISSDNLTLVVCCSGEKGLQALFFDSRNLINKAKPTKTPFYVLLLSKSIAYAVVSLHWNPSLETTRYLAICVSSGSLHMLAVTDGVQELGRKPPEFGACSVCWSPRGKQIMVGKEDGSMQQYTPALEIRRTIPVYDAVEMKVKVADVLWLSTLQVAFSYVPNGDEGDFQPSLFVVNLPPAKEVTKSPSWRNYEDPCYGEPGARPPHFMTSYIDGWNMFVIASAHGSETAVIGKDKKTDVWEIWNLDDSCRAQLPMEEGKDEPSPLGCAVLYTAQDRIIVDDTRECSAMPVFVMLSCDGNLSLFHMINLQSTDDYPNVTIRPRQLTSDGERATVVTKVGNIDNTKLAPSIAGKAKLSSKPSMLVTTSTPKQPREPQITENLQFSMTPLQGKGGALLPPPSNELDSTANFASKSLSFPNTGAASPANRDGRVLQKQKESESVLQATPLPGQDAFRRPAPEKAFVLPAARDSRGSPMPVVPTSDPRGQRQTIPEFDSLPKLQSSTSSLSSSSAMTGQSQGKEAKLTTDNLKRRITRKSQDKPLLPHGSATSSIMDGLISEVMDFEKELSEFIEESTQTEHVVALLGSEEDKVKLKKNVDSLSHFQQEITRTSQEQHEEIQSVRTLSLEAFAALQNAETQRKRVENPVYRDALYAKPLDMSDQRRMKEVRCWYQYIRDTIKEVDAALNDQWNTFMEKQKSSALRQSKRRIEIEERNTVRRAISNQTKILHDQELKLLLLDQQLDRLRLANTSLQHYEDEVAHSKQASSLDQTADSTDLPTMASALIRGYREKSPKNEVGDAANLSANKNSSFTKISPQKASQLSGYLASKKSTSVRPTAGRKSKFLAKPFVKNASSRASPPSVGKTLSTRSLSHTSDYTVCSEDSIATESPVSLDKAEERENPEYMFSGLGAAVTVEPTMLRNGGPPTIVRKMTPVLPSFHTSPTPGLSNEADRSAASASPAPQSTSVEGSSTITYGGPETPMVKPTVKYNPTSAQMEAASNLNHPPQVINIKDLSDPEVVNVIPFSHKFQPKPDIPPGVASEMQKVLNAAQASKIQPPASPFAQHPVSSTDVDDHVIVPASTKTEVAPPVQAPVSSSSQPNAGSLFGQPQTTMPFSSSFVMKMPGQSSLSFAPPSSSTNGQPLPPSSSRAPPSFSTSDQPLPPSSSRAPPSFSTSDQPLPPSSSRAPLTIPGGSGDGHLGRASPAVSGIGSSPALYNLVATGKPPSAAANRDGLVEGTQPPPQYKADDVEKTAPRDDTSRSIESPKIIVQPSSQRSDAAGTPESSDTSSPPHLEPVHPSNESQSSSVPPPAEPLASSTSLQESKVASKDIPPESSHDASAKPSDDDSKQQTGPPPLSAAPTNVFGSNTAIGSASSFGALTDAASLVGRPETNAGLFSQGLGQPTSHSPQPGLFQLLKSSSASAFGSSGPRTATPTTAPSIFHQSVSSAPANLLSVKAATPSTSSSGEGPAIGASPVGVQPPAYAPAPAAESSPGPSKPLDGTGGAFGGSSTPPIESPSSSVFAAPPTSSTPQGFPAAASPSAPPLFGVVPAASAGSGFGTFSAQTSATSTFGTAPTTNAFQSFGTATTAGGFNNTTPGFVSASGGFGGGFLSGLGSTPKQQSTNTNPFASPEATAQSADSKSLFGNTASSPFSSGFGQSATSSAFGAKPAEVQQSFGTFAKPATAAFGSAPVFGSPTGFGAKPAFGSAASQFGGAASFGSPAAFGAQSGMSAGNQSGSGGFGSSSTGFEAFANSNSPGFGALAEQSGGGFASSNNQKPVFGGGFGAQSQGFGSASAPSFGSNPSAGFASSSFGSNPKPSFSGWR